LDDPAPCDSLPDELWDAVLADPRAAGRSPPILQCRLSEGSVHGGYAAILLDSAMGLAVQSTLPAGTGYTTLEFKISFVRGMSEMSGVVRTEGRVLNAGRRVAAAEARITDSKGRLIAHATTTCLVLEIPKVNANS
jgi:uncharacterized protein (TIGR00369 family)